MALLYRSTLCGSTKLPIPTEGLVEVNLIVCWNDSGINVPAAFHLGDLKKLEEGIPTGRLWVGVAPPLKSAGNPLRSYILVAPVQIVIAKFGAAAWANREVGGWI